MEPYVLMLAILQHNMVVKLFLLFPKRMATMFLHGSLVLLHGVLPKSYLFKEKQMICPS